MSVEIVEGGAPLDPLRGAYWSYQFYLELGVRIAEATQTKGFTRDEVVELTAWRREVHAEAERLRKILTGETRS